MKDLLNHRLFNSLIHTERTTARECWLGYFFGPFSVMLLNSVLTNYLNVYYTDVMGLGSLWNGMFLSLFPIVVKMLDALTFVLMGIIVDRFCSRQGKARPWILFSAPLMVISMILLFTVPMGNPVIMALWIFLSYNLFYSVAYTAYNTAHTLMVPLSTKDPADRSRLSIIANSTGMPSGAIVAVLFPSFIMPFVGVNRNRWVPVMAAIAVTALPFILMEYYFTRERVTEEELQKRSSASESSAKAVPPEHLSLSKQLRLCLRSHRWIVLMLFLCLNHLVNCLASSSTFYYCNWVLGSYNDGITQTLYYALGNAPLGLGIFLCRPICKKLGRQNAFIWGFLLAALGTALCLAAPSSLPMVLAGQLIKSCGLIPSTFMTTAMLGDALDDVEKVTGKRCDGFSSSAYNVIATLATGLALCILNFGLTRLGYVAPSATGTLPVQNAAVQNFFVFTAIGCQTICYPLIAALFFLSEKSKKRKK